MILAADVGGTKTNVGLFDPNTPAPDRDGPTLLYRASTPSRGRAGLAEIVDELLEAAQAAGLSAPLKAACFGVAGPVISGRCETPNLPWVIDAGALATRFAIPQVHLINDLVATAEGVTALREDELETLQAGCPPPGPSTRAILAPGTGLGTAGLVWTGDDWLALASEGGHVELAPRNEEEDALVRFLRARFPGHVSLERAVSGPGLQHIYEHLSARRVGPPNLAVEAAIAAGRGDAPRLVSQEALAKTCPRCVRALELFCGLLGAAAGNLALTVMATGGVYLAGGIPPKILPALRHPDLVEAFGAKGRLRAVLAKVPLHVILNPETALLGAARHAARALRRATA